MRTAFVTIDPATGLQLGTASAEQVAAYERANVPNRRGLAGLLGRAFDRPVLVGAVLVDEVRAD